MCKLEPKWGDLRSRNSDTAKRGSWSGFRVWGLGARVSGPLNNLNPCSQFFNPYGGRCVLRAPDPKPYSLQTSARISRSPFQKHQQSLSLDFPSPQAATSAREPNSYKLPSLYCRSLLRACSGSTGVKACGFESSQLAQVLFFTAPSTEQSEHGTRSGRKRLPE